MIFTTLKSSSFRALKMIATGAFLLFLFLETLFKVTAILQ